MLSENSNTAANSWTSEILFTNATDLNNDFNMKSSNSNINKRNSRCEYNIIKNNEIGNNYCINRLPIDDRTKLASLQIFAFIVLQAWRKSSKQNKQLLLSIEDLQKFVSISIKIIKKKQQQKKCKLLN